MCHSRLGETRQARILARRAVECCAPDDPLRAAGEIRLAEIDLDEVDLPSGSGVAVRGFFV
jgi:hypothetical protein